MDHEIRKRLNWVKVYEQTRNAGITCFRCGISRPTLRKWWQCYQSEGLEGLQSRRRCPRSSPNQKVFANEEGRILSLRSERKMGARRIKNELYRHHTTNLSLATTHKVLVHNQVKPLKGKRREKIWNRYARPIWTLPIYRSRWLRSVYGYWAIFPENCIQHFGFFGKAV